MSASESMSLLREENESWSEEVYERLVELSVEYCAGKEMITTNNSNATILRSFWTATITPSLSASELREFTKLTDTESVQVYQVLAKAGRRPHAYYYNNGRKIAKRVGDINESGLRAEVRAAAGGAGGKGTGKKK